VPAGRVIATGAVAGISQASVDLERNDDDFKSLPDQLAGPALDGWRRAGPLRPASARRRQPTFAETGRQIHVLEFRAVRGTGGGPEKTILHGATLACCVRVTLCYLRSAVDPQYVVDRRARELGVAYYEVRERHPLDPRSWFHVRQLVRDLRVDIIHAHDYKTNLLTLALARTDGALALSTVHGWTGHSLRERLVYYPADRRLLAFFPRVIAVSSEIRDRLVRAGADPSRVTVLLNGIDADHFRRDCRRGSIVRRQLGLAPEATVVGAIGRLEPQKNFPLLLRAVKALSARRPDLRLVIAGEGSARSDLERLCRALGLERTCLLLGHRSDVAGLHHALDLFVQSSDYEGTPNAVLEAMAMETPVVATDVGGTSELARHGEHALIVPPRRLDALVEAMELVVGDTQATARRVRAARARVEQELSFRARVRRLEEIYCELVANRAGSNRSRPT
jgi:glycosyltransferase involved in cell wall biosynthesis